MDGLDGIVTLEVPITGAETTTTYIGGTAGNYPRAVWLEKGYIWEVVDFAMTAATGYTAASDFYKFYLKDASGNTIGTLTETIAVNPATANDASPVDAYKRIDCESAGSYLQIVPVQSGAGLLMNGLKAVIRVKKLRNA